MCGLMSIAVSSYRYCSRRSDESLREKLVRLAREKPRYGYRRLQVLVEREGERVNHKRLWRAYREAGLCLKRKKRRHCVRVGSPRPALTGANQEWALDFAHDVIAAGRTIRVLSVVDAFTRECLALEVDTGFASRRVTRVLDGIIARRGRLQAIRCDNGPELTSRHFLHGRWRGRSSCATSSRASRRRTRMWRAFTEDCARSAWSRPATRASHGSGGIWSAGTMPRASLASTSCGSNGTASGYTPAATGWEVAVCSAIRQFGRLGTSDGSRPSKLPGCPLIHPKPGCGT